MKKVPEKIDKGFCLNYWRLSYRRKFIRSCFILLLLPLFFLVRPSAEIFGLPPTPAAFALLFLALIQISYNFYRWWLEKWHEGPIPAAKQDRHASLVQSRSIALVIALAWLPAGGWSNRYIVIFKLLLLVAMCLLALGVFRFQDLLLKYEPDRRSAIRQTFKQLLYAPLFKVVTPENISSEERGRFALGVNCTGLAVWLVLVAAGLLGYWAAQGLTIR